MFRVETNCEIFIPRPKVQKIWNDCQITELFDVLNQDLYHLTFLLLYGGG
jgi:hypothetical protein